MHRTIYKTFVNQDLNGKHIHHLDLNHNNNNIENLVAIPVSLHNRIHDFHRKCETLDILEKFEKDGKHQYYDKGTGTCFPSKFINADYYLNKYDYNSVENNILNSIENLQNELDFYINERNNKLLDF